MSRLDLVRKDLEKVEVRLVGVLAEERKMVEDLKRMWVRKGQATLELKEYGYEEAVR